jgi:hypothetical protein
MLDISGGCALVKFGERVQVGVTQAHWSVSQVASV